MKKIEAHKHFTLGENKQWFPNEEFIIHMAEPRCFIRFDNSLAMFCDYDEFYKSIANVQWIDGKPSNEEIERVLIDAWNFILIEDEILDNDFQDENYL